MRRLFTGACILVLALAWLGGCSVAPRPDLELVTNGGYCHVMGHPVDVEEASMNPRLYSDYNGKRYLFCCKACKPKFEENPGKWITNPAPPETE